MEHNFYSVIPTHILRDNTLKDKAKLLYCDISSLCNKEGYCYASNEYFSELYGVTTETISRLLRELNSKNYIKIEYKKRGAEVTSRLIFLSIHAQNNQPSIDKIINRTIDKKVKDNNISVNNININKEASAILELFNSVCTSFPKAFKLSKDRKKHINARINDGYKIDDFKKAFELAERSEFLKSSNFCNFDWLIKDRNLAKTLDGNYNDKKTNYDIDKW